MNQSQTAGALPTKSCDPVGSSGIIGTFAKGLPPPLSLCLGYVVHVFLTRSPLTYPPVTLQIDSLDLHALATPPAFVLSQDQTLHLLVRPNHSSLEKPLKSFARKRKIQSDLPHRVVQISTKKALIHMRLVRMKVVGS